MPEEIIQSGNAVFQKYSSLIISPENIAHNVRVIRSITDRTIIAVVKENGYGLGLWNEYQILKDLDIHFYAVTNCEEALALRRFGCQEPVLVMSPVLEYEYCRKLAEADIIFSLESEAQAALLEQLYQETGIRPRVHVKFETGMGRYGFRWNQLPDLKSLTGHMEVEGCFTHLAGEPYHYEKQVSLQRSRFLEAAASMEAMGVPSGMKHISNSSALMTLGDLGMDGVRAGSALIGKAASNGKSALKPGQPGLKPAVWLEAPVYEIKELKKGDTIGYQSRLRLKRDSRLALIRTGHSDGIFLGYADTPEQFFHGILHLLAVKLLPRRYRKTVSIGSRQAPLAGRLGVAHLMADVTDIPCQPGDVAKIAVNPLLIHPAVPKIIRTASARTGKSEKGV